MEIEYIYILYIQSMSGPGSFALQSFPSFGPDGPGFGTDFAFGAPETGGFGELPTAGLSTGREKQVYQL